MSHEDHKAHAPKRLRFAVVTISDTRTIENDETGRVIIDILEKDGHEVAQHDVIRDSRDAIRTAISGHAKAGNSDVIISNGGTGISKKDVTIESVEPILEKTLAGFGELFRTLSYDDIGTSAIMSRSLAGVLDGRIVICLPGSPRAAELAMRKLIIPEIGHMVWEARR